MTLLDDYETFHCLAVTSRDVDPAYPVLGELLTPIPAGRRAEAVVIYVAYYDLSSALIAYDKRADGVRLADLPQLPAATERRAHRDPKQLRRHLTDLDTLSDIHGGLDRMLSDDLPRHPKAAWAELRRRIETVHGNGRWASYKTAEILQKVCGWPIDAPDMGMAGASGPAAGLRLLGGRGTPAQMEIHGAHLAARLRAHGAPDSSLATVETTLCDFHALHDGRYYVGHDIDQMQTQFTRSHAPKAVWDARAKALPHAYLGELNGWAGVDKLRARRYRETGEIVDRAS